MCNTTLAWPPITFQLASPLTPTHTKVFFCQHSWPSSLTHNFIPRFFDLAVAIYHIMIYVDNRIGFNEQLVPEEHEQGDYSIKGHVQLRQMVFGNAQLC